MSNNFTEGVLFSAQEYVDAYVGLKKVPSWAL